MKTRGILLFSTLLALSIVTKAQLNVIEYKLDNGFTVILNPDETANAIFGAVAVNTGSKNDPIVATGMSHYLEHLLFKGTATLGTHNYKKEKPHLDSVIFYYDKLGQTKDDEQRDKIQMKINYHSVEASKYAMPNEFDKLLKNIGSTSINATTSNDLTIYFNEFPSHQIEKWLDLYAHRFQDPVFRSFQSELEVVYEEKNRAMDDMQRRLFTIFSQEFYKGHPYGDKGTLGTIEHLKNPSLTKMYEYFDAYYKANNMALILAGNFDPEIVKPLIEAKFGVLEAGEIPVNDIAQPYAIKGRQVKNKRLTPIKVGVMGFRTVPGGHADELALEVAGYLLQNESGTGFIDQLQNDGKLMMAWSFSENMDEAGNQYFIYIPKILIQSLKGAEKQMLGQVNRLKDGDFPDDLMLSVKNEMYKNYQLSIEEPSNRGYMFSNMFRRGKSYQEISNYPERLELITKEDIKRVCKKYFGEDYFVLQSRTGFPKKTKLEKPKFNPVQVDQSKESVYANKFNKIPETKVNDRFLEFKKDLTQLDIDGNDLFIVENPINDIYELSFQYHYGAISDPDLEILANLMEYTHPKDQKLNDFRKEIALLGSTYYFEATKSNFIVHITGIEKNLDQVISKINGLLTNPNVDENSFKILINNFKTNRKAEKEEPALIAQALAQYGLYGKNSTLSNRSTAKAISKMNYLDVLAKLEEVKKHKISIHFTGKTDANDIESILKSNYSFKTNPPSLLPYNPMILDRTENQIFVLHNSKVVQSNMFFIKKSSLFSKELRAPQKLFNAYFSGGFSGILTQEIREYRSLAYSSSAGYRSHSSPIGNNFFYTYIGCQADKTNDAVSVAFDLLNNMPEKPERFNTVRNSVVLSQNAEYPNFRSLSKKVEAFQYLGYKTDPNIESNKAYAKLNFKDIVSFYKENLQNQKAFLGIYGDTKRFSLDKLKQFGTVKEINLEDVIKF